MCSMMVQTRKHDSCSKTLHRVHLWVRFVRFSVIYAILCQVSHPCQWLGSFTLPLALLPPPCKYLRYTRTHRTYILLLGSVVHCSILSRGSILLRLVRCDSTGAMSFTGKNLFVRSCRKTSVMLRNSSAQPSITFHWVTSS
jgi:hypothetical protein